MKKSITSVGLIILAFFFGCLIISPILYILSPNYQNGQSNNRIERNEIIVDQDKDLLNNTRSKSTDIITPNIKKIPPTLYIGNCMDFQKPINQQDYVCIHSIYLYNGNIPANVSISFLGYASANISTISVNGSNLPFKAGSYLYGNITTWIKLGTNELLYEITDKYGNKVSNTEQLIVERQPQTFNGYECTGDCSGHQAGYDWAEENDINDVNDCSGNSESFIEGCMSYVEEYYSE